MGIRHPRGIGDKRAVPALIRAFPETCTKSANDLLYKAGDTDLLAFMVKHDYIPNDKQNNAKDYVFGTPMTEFSATLEALTGETNGAEELRNVNLIGSPAQQYQQRRLYQRCAERWERWWIANWNKHVDNEAYSTVNLKPLNEEHHEIRPFPRNGIIGTTYVGGLLPSVRNPTAKMVFLDLDTGRWGGLPENLKAAAGEPERLDDILAWAAREGFDLMGTEYKPSPTHEPHYVLRGLSMTLWQNPPDRWKTLKDELRGDKPIEMGTRTDGLLCRFDPEDARYDAAAMATFLYTTREGGHGAIFIGVEVHDTSEQRSAKPPPDIALNTYGGIRGRRFTHCSILESKP